MWVCRITDQTSTNHGHVNRCPVIAPTERTRAHKNGNSNAWAWNMSNSTSLPIVQASAPPTSNVHASNAPPPMRRAAIAARTTHSALTAPTPTALPTPGEKACANGAIRSA